MNQVNRQKTQQQQKIANKLADTFGIDAEKIRFLNKYDELEPWIPPSELMAIAREHGTFQEVSVNYDKYIQESQQVVCVAKVVNSQGTIFSNFGVATAKVEAEIAADVIASGRALGAVLRDAGFNPLKSNPIIDIAFNPKKQDAYQSSGHSFEGIKRTRDIRRIHALAEELGMIVFDDRSGERIRDDAAYRWFLAEHFPDLFESMEKASVVGLSAMNRQRVIDKLIEERDGEFTTF